MSPFKISDHIEFDSKGRASCPCCENDKGKLNKNLSLVPDTDGAYKCHRGCLPADIRSALGADKPKQVPQSQARSQLLTYTPQDVRQDHNYLIGTSETAEQARAWLTQRGITDTLMIRHLLGLRRIRVDKQMMWAIVVPIPANPDRTAYYRKYRVSPWHQHSLRPWHQPGVPATVLFTHKPDNANETWLCEGEWDAISLASVVRDASLQIAVATFTTGCQSIPNDTQLSRLPGKVMIWYDRDKPGQDGAAKLAKALGDRATIRLAPGTDEQVNAVKGWDISNALDAGYKVDDFREAQTITTTVDKSLKSRLITHAQLMARAPDFIDFLIPDLLTYELYLLAAPPRSGKTLLVMTLAHAIASGGKFLDRPTTQGSVLYINLEDSETKVKTRALAQGWDENLPVYWIDKFKLEELLELEDIIDTIPDLRLIVIDTLSRAKTAAVQESSAEMSTVLEPLQELCKQRNICALLVHHTGKVKEAEGHLVDVFDSIRGSSAIRATTRGCWVILPSENCYRLVTENGYGKEDLKIRLNPENWGWDLLGKWNPTIDGSQKDQILEYLRLTTQATVSQISEGTGLAAKTVGTVLGRLQADDMVTKIGGKGRLPAIYCRSSNLLQQLEQKLEHPKPDVASDSGLLQQKTLFSVNGSDQGINCHIPADPADPLLEQMDQRQTVHADSVSGKQQNSVHEVIQNVQLLHSEGNTADDDPLIQNHPPSLVGASTKTGSNPSVEPVSSSNFCSNNGQFVGANGGKTGTDLLIQPEKVGSAPLPTGLKEGDRISVYIKGKWAPAKYGCLVKGRSIVSELKPTGLHDCHRVVADGRSQLVTMNEIRGMRPFEDEDD